MLRTVLKRSLIAVMLATASVTVSYAALDAKTYYAGEEKVSALISAAELYPMVKNGGKTKDGKKVVIIDIVPEEVLQVFYEGDAAGIAKLGMSWAPFADKAGFLGHIPGSQVFVSHRPNQGHTSTRNDGPMDVVHQLGDEKTMNNFIQSQGIDADTLVVLTSSDFSRAPYCATRAFWTLRYWGMSVKNLRILDGANIAWSEYIAKEHAAEKATMGLQKGKQTVKVEKSTLKVTDFPKKFVSARAVIGEMIKGVDDGSFAKGTKYALDVRPPSAFFIKDMEAMKGQLKGAKIPVPAGTSGMPQFDMNQFSPIVLEGSNVGAFKGAKGPIPVIVGAKPSAIDAQIKDSILTKGKNSKGEMYDITPGIMYNMGFIKDDAGKPVFGYFGTYKKPSDIATKAKWVGDKPLTVEQMFARVFPDKNKEIIAYCNSGSAASIHYFYLSQVLKYKNVKDYDGSMIEWANLAGFEPNDTNLKAGLSVVRPDVYTWFPKTPLNMPSVAIYASGEAHPFTISKGKDGKYIALDEVTGKTCVVDTPDCGIKTGGNLKGDLKWDTVSRSQHVLFRPTAKVNDGVFAGKDDPMKKFEYNAKANWPSIKAHPEYKGEAFETIKVDEFCK